MVPLPGWENCYVIVGSAAGALVGLQFVVLTLVAERIQGGVQAHALETFTTPTIVHFGVVLLLAGAMVAPLGNPLPLALVWCAVGLAGTVYAVLIARCLRQLSIYKAQMSDWIFYFLLPLASYATIGAAGILLARGERQSAFAVAAAVLALLLTGVHNAWDIVTYHVLLSQTEKPKQAE